MKERILQNSVYTLQPAILNNLVALGNAAAKKLDAKLFRLITVRCSQINGCAFCLHMHLAEAREAGISQEKLDFLNAWKEIPLYSKQERAALYWAEAVTLLAGKGVSDADFATVSQEFSEEEIVNLTTAIVTINSWNRIAVACGFIPSLSVH